MNLVLVFAEDFIDREHVRLSGRRLSHLQEIHRVEIGQTLTIGLAHREQPSSPSIGTGTVTAIDSEAVDLQVALTAPPPEALPVTVVLALPRPKMLKRVIQTLTSMGVKRLCLINSYRVEKSYWQSPVLTPEALETQCILGLEQAKDTWLPEISLHPLFKPFVEDELPAIASNTQALLAHPKGTSACPSGINTPTTLAIGPEGGFIDYEVDKFAEAGFSAVHLGERILRVEAAVPVLLARLFH